MGEKKTCREFILFFHRLVRVKIRKNKAGQENNYLLYAVSVLRIIGLHSDFLQPVPRGNRPCLWLVLFDNQSFDYQDSHTGDLHPLSWSNARK